MKGTEAAAAAAGTNAAEGQDHALDDYPGGDFPSCCLLVGRNRMRVGCMHLAAAEAHHPAHISKFGTYPDTPEQMQLCNGVLGKG